VITADIDELLKKLDRALLLCYGSCMQVWMNDPITKKPSVSLSFMVTTGVAYLVASWMQILDHTGTVSDLKELFITSVGLYGARRTKFMSDKKENPE